MPITRGRARPLAALAALAVVLTPAAAVARASQQATPTRPNGSAAIGKHPAAPVNLVVASGRHGTSLTWTSNDTTGFQIEQATDTAMSTNVRVYTMRGPGDEFTPYGLTKGQTYYFQVRAGASGAHSAYSNQVVAKVNSLEQPVRVMTYNILEASRDGQHEGNGVIAPWSQRKPQAAALIRQAQPDLVAIEEGSDFIGHGKHTRQVDSLRSAIGSPYALAHTEIAPPHRHYFRTGVYILYNKSTFKAIGKGNHWKIGKPHWAAYQTFKNRQTGAKFVFVATHLIIGYGRDKDATREAETTTLIHKARKHAHKLHLPMVYAGDFNSATAADPHFSFDGAGAAMRAANIADAFSVAQSHTDRAYNSANQYFRRPKKTGDRIDHVYAPAGVAVRSAGIVLSLRHGKFVGAIPSDHNPLIADLLYPY